MVTPGLPYDSMCLVIKQWKRKRQIEKQQTLTSTRVNKLPRNFRKENTTKGIQQLSVNRSTFDWATLLAFQAHAEPLMRLPPHQMFSSGRDIQREDSIALLSVSSTCPQVSKLSVIMKPHLGRVVTGCQPTGRIQGEMHTPQTSCLESSQDLNSGLGEQCIVVEGCKGS